MATHTGLTSAVLNYKPPDPLVPEFEVPLDRATVADPNKTSLLSGAGRVDDLTPWIGTELHGLQLNQLTNAQRDELALLVAERGVVFLRDQDWTLDQQYELTKYWGVPDRDPIQVDPRHVTVLGRDNDRGYANFGVDFHNDHSFEVNPPAYTILRMDKTPPTGGDTVFTSQVALFDKLSTTYQRLLEGLHGVHSSEVSYINVINGGGKAFRPPTRQEHPLVTTFLYPEQRKRSTFPLEATTQVRTHPVTKLKTPYYNPTMMIHIKELKEQEATHTLAFLREHTHAADDLTVRCAVDASSRGRLGQNRSVAHRAVPGGYDKSLREGTRTAVFGERPFLRSDNGADLE